MGKAAVAILLLFYVFSMVRSLFKIPLLFLLIGACLGLLLRWHFLSPFEWLRFTNWLHAHSHMMFLGWITNFIFLATIHAFLTEEHQSRFRGLFLFLQVPIVGMLVSFPLQGYGAFSIFFLSVHILLCFIVCVRLFRILRHSGSEGKDYILMSFLFFALSTIGAFALGPLAANGFQQTQWYYLSIYYYLHFQYNGFFIFAVLGLFIRFLEQRDIVFSAYHNKLTKISLFIACFPAYFLSTLWSDPPAIIFWLAAGAALAQLVSLAAMLKLLYPIRTSIRENVSRWAFAFLTLALVAYVGKLILQALSAVPAIAFFASEVRFFVLAYLHLVLIGVITLFSLAWLQVHKILCELKFGGLLLVSGFVGSEILMIATPLYGSFYSVFAPFLFIFSLLMVVGISLLRLNGGKHRQ
jgi:hypothetical protein